MSQFWQFSREIFFSFCAIAPKLHYSRKSMQREKKRKSGMGWSLTRSAKSLAASLMNKLAIIQGRWNQGDRLCPPQYYSIPPRISKPSYDPVIELTIVSSTIASFLSILWNRQKIVSSILGITFTYLLIMLLVYNRVKSRPCENSLADFYNSPLLKAWTSFLELSDMQKCKSPLENFHMVST